MTVRTRFAPSPTGYLHIGGARTALFCWAYARRHGGTFILRVEDTDRERSTQESVQAILDGHAVARPRLDEGPYFQMQRLARYKEVAEQLIATGHAYCDYSRRKSSTRCASSSARAARSRATTALSARRTRGAGPGADPLQDSARGRRHLERSRQRADHVPQRGARRSRAPARRRRADLQLRRGRRRHRHGDHARDPRRRPRQQHAAPDQHLSGRSERTCRSSRTCR